MSFEVFQDKVTGILEKVNGVTAVFHHEDGMHYALCSDGTMIIGNTQTIKFAVLWGSGHHALAEL